MPRGLASPLHCFCQGGCCNFRLNGVVKTEGRPQRNDSEKNREESRSNLGRQCFQVVWQQKKKKEREKNGVNNGHKVGLLFCFLIFLFNPGGTYSCLRASRRIHWEKIFDVTGVKENN